MIPDQPDPQDWWDCPPAEPLAGISLARMALWLLLLIPMIEVWAALTAPRQHKD